MWRLHFTTASDVAFLLLPLVFLPLAESRFYPTARRIVLRSISMFSAPLFSCHLLQSHKLRHVERRNSRRSGVYPTARHAASRVSHRVAIARKMCLSRLLRENLDQVRRKSSGRNPTFTPAAEGRVERCALRCYVVFLFQDSPEGDDGKR